MQCYKAQGTYGAHLLIIIRQLQIFFVSPIFPTPGSLFVMNKQSSFQLDIHKRKIKLSRTEILEMLTFIFFMDDNITRFTTCQIGANIIEQIIQEKIGLWLLWKIPIVTWTLMDNYH